MNTYRKINFVSILCGLLLALLYSCAGQKNTLTNRKLQNLSARYNYIYNANVLLDEYLENVYLNNKQDFDSFLPLYYAPAIADANNAGTKIKELDEIEQKARTIIAEKNLSNYIDDAYILLGKSNFYQGKYYNATEYFDYVAHTYKKNHKIYLNALNWKARSFMELKDFITAQKLLDTVKIELDSVKRYKAEPLATLAFLYLTKGENTQAIEYLQNALKAHPSNNDKITWTYTLAQLYEQEKIYDKSLAAYHKVEKSNAPFEMYFNAKLSKIRINELLDGKNFDRRLQLHRMLKDEKNIDFTDQIYYEIAEDYYNGKDYEKAEEYYNLSIRKSTKNNTQKALSYLKIADLNFKHYNNYVKAKLYYDSTVLSLPKTHPLYTAIANKAQNLAYLQQRYETISLQDTLQKIAQLPAARRADALSAYFESIAPTTSASTNENDNKTGNTGRNDLNYRPTTGGSFYFSNTNAISRGYNEFKKRWGNRKLTNNWRQSSKPSSQEQPNNAIANNGPGELPTNPDEVVPEAPTATANTTAYLDSIPLTPTQLEKSNQKIIAAYLEMGSFYQQVLKDKPEAIKTYETLLSRFPHNDKLDRIYYSLYLAYQGINVQKSNEYKNLVLANYPASVFAKTILDPNYSIKQNQLEITLNKEFEDVFAKLKAKDFKAVITAANNINQRFPGNSMAAQYDYLKAIAIGRTENADRLISAFKEITNQYPKDKLIKPLVEQHLLYINANLNEFKQRKVALPDYDPNEIPFAEASKKGIRKDEPIIANVLDPMGKKSANTVPKPVETQQPATTLPKPIAEKKAEVIPPVVNDAKKEIAVKKGDSTGTIPPVTKQKDSTLLAKNIKDLKKDTLSAVSKPLDNTPVVDKPAPVKDDLFNAASSNLYYYVIAVNKVDVSLSSSRFGIGQFNRGNYTGANLRHQLKELDEDQLITVGDFTNPGDVKAYQRLINAQLGNIMKIPATNYTTFVISKENLDKITNKQTLERYIRYINSNEL